MKCIVKDCPNYWGEGGFHGALCIPCHDMLTTGEVEYGNTFIHKMRDYIKELERQRDEPEHLP